MVPDHLTVGPAYVKLWTAAFDARHDRQRLLKILRKATAGFVAITDAPGNCFVGELLELYPDARFVCVRRDKIRWWESWKSVTNQAGAGFLSWFLAPVPGKRWYPKLVAQFLEMLVFPPTDDCHKVCSHTSA
jgi:hypothetical protein